MENIQKHIVDEIYNRLENLKYDYWIYSSNIHFLNAIGPLTFMSEQDFDNNLYQTFLDHARELYHKQYLCDYNEQKKNEEHFGVEQ